MTGEDLDWFWRGWFLHDGPSSTRRWPGWRSRTAGAVATVVNRGELVLPTAVEFTFADGTTQTVVVPAEAYFSTDTAGASVPLGGRTVVSARINADGDYPDDDPSDDERRL